MDYSNLKPGDHLCCLYETEEEHRAVLTPFLRQGLERGEKVAYIVDARVSGDILGYLQEDGLDVEPYLTRGQLVILTRDDAYMREGVFDPDGMIAVLRAETEQALAEGYAALRVTGEMTWALRGLPGSERLIEYEAKLNEFFPGSQCLAICQYDRRRFDPEVLLDVLRTHPITAVGAEVYHNFYYIPPDELLGGDLPAAELGRWLENLAQRKRAEEALQERVKELTCLYAVSRDMQKVLSVDELCRRLIEHLVPAMQFPEITMPVIELDGKRFTSARCTDGLSHGLHAEIRVGGEVRGCLWVYYAEDKPFLIPEEQNLVNGIAEGLEVWLERKRAEEALRESEERYRAIFEQAADSIALVDAETGTLVEFNQRAYENLRYTREEFETLKIPDFEVIESAEEVAKHIERIVKEGADTFETKHRTKDGEIRDILVSSTAITIDRRDFVQSIWTDITERKRAEEEIKQRNVELTTLLDVSQRLAGRLDLDELLDTVARSIVETLPAAEAASLWLHDEGRNESVVRAWAGHDDEAIAGLALSPDTSLVGLVCRSRQPHITDNTAREPAFEPLGRPALDAVRSVLGVPLLVEGRPIGALFADNFSRVQAFDEGDLRLLQSLAGQAAIALENARLFEQVQTGRERLRQLTQQVVSAQEEERRRLSRELHDELGQALTGIGFDLAGIEKELPSDVAPTVREKLAEARSLAAQADERVSELALDLRPYMLDDLGLVSALRWYANRYAKRLDIEVEVEAIGLEERLIPEVETALYRVVQEALTNVAKHAQANRVRIRLDRKESAVLAIVEDDGQGFDVETIAGPAAQERGAGLLGIRERAHSLGGTVGIQSTPGHGTRLTIEIPV